MKDKIENKKALITAARIAKGGKIPEAEQFWKELKERLDVHAEAEKGLVEPREIRS